MDSRSVRGGLLTSFRMPLRFLRGSYTRLSFTVLALATGVALVCALDLVNRGVLRAFDEIIDTMAGRAALQVDVEDGGWFSENLVTAIKAVPGVEQAIPVVSATAFTIGDPGEAIAVFAFDLTDQAAIDAYSGSPSDTPLLSDSVAFLNQADSVIVTHEFADRHQLRIDSPIVLDTTSGQRTFTVRALLEPHGIARAYGGNLFVMDVQAAEATFTRPGMVNRIDVVLRRDAALSAMAAAIARVVPTGLRVASPAQRKADLQSLMRSLQVILQALGLIALMAAFLIAFNRLNAIFEERTWQAGVLRAQGARRSFVCTELLKEGLVLGALGVLIGIPAGIGLGHAMFPVIAATTALNYRIVAPQGELGLSPASIALAVGLGLGASVLAALLPAWRTSRISVATIVRGRGQEFDVPAPHLFTLRAVAVAAAVAAVLGQWITRQAGWGIAATVLVLVAVHMIARPLLEAVLAPVSRGRLREQFGVVGGFLRLTVARRPRQTASAIAMVAIGLAAVVWLSIVAVSFERTAIGVFEQSMRGDLVVSSAHIGGGALEMPIDENFGTRLREVSGVRSVAGIRLANWEYAGGPIVLDAFDPVYFKDAEFGRWPLLGEAQPDVWQAVALGHTVIVSSNFAQNLNVAVGDRIHLDTPRGPLSLSVGGITTDFASPRGTIEMSRETYVAYWADRTVTRFFVETDGTRALADVRKEIVSSLGTSGAAWRVISSGELVAYWGEQVRRAFASVYVLGLVIFVVILVGLVDNLSGSVVEHTRELGMLRALGLRRRGAGTLVIIEATFIVVIGLGLAFAAGLAIGTLWVSATIPSMLGWVIELHLPMLPLVATGAATLIVCLLAALIPGRRAARLEPAVALRSE